MFFPANVYISVELTLTVFNGNVVIVESPITKMVVFLSGVAAVSNNTANREIKIDFLIRYIISSICYCILCSPSQRTFQVPSLGKPGFRGSVQPSHPAHIMAMVVSRAPLPGR